MSGFPEQERVLVSTGATAFADNLPSRSAVGAYQSAEDMVAPAVEGYQISTFLGRGGMGTVWRALQLSTRREVALKLLAISGERQDRARRRFDREVELTARLEHPHIARVYDSGLNHGVYFYAMELIHNAIPLDQYAVAAGWTRGQILSVFRLVCLAVYHAHQRGIIHRDLKPSNILVSADGTPHVVDFGLAQPLEHEIQYEANAPPAQPGATFDGEIAGTPAFMSPEQAAGLSGALDVRTDVYSLGVILYRMLTGRSPHDLSGSPAELLDRIRCHDANPPDARVGLDRDLREILSKALARDREARYGSAEALARDLNNYLSGDPITARRPTFLYVARKRLRRHRVLASVIGACLIVLSATAAYSWRTVTHARDVAVTALANEGSQRRSAEIRLAQTEVLAAGLLARAGSSQAAVDQCWHAYELYASNHVPPVAPAGLLLRLQETLLPPLNQRRAGTGPVHAMAYGSAGLLRILAGNSLLSIDSVQCGPPRIEGSLEQLRRATWARDGQRLVALYSRDPDRPAAGAVCRILAENGSLEAQIPISDVVISNLASSGDGDIIAYAGLTAGKSSTAARVGIDDPERLAHAGRLVCVNTRSATAPRVLAAGLSISETVAVSPDAKLVLYGGDAGAVRRWSVTSGGEILPIKVGAAPITTMRFSRDGRQLLIGARDGMLALVDGEGDIGRRRLPGHSSGVCAVAFSPDGRWAASGDESGKLIVWDLESHVARATLLGFRNGVDALEFAPDGRHLAALARDGSLRTWYLGEAPYAGGTLVGVDLPSRTLASRRNGLNPEAAISTVCISPDGLIGAVGRVDGALDLFDVESGKILRRISFGAGAAAASPTNPSSQERRTDVPSGAIRAITFQGDDDGRVTFMDGAGTAWTCELPTGHVVSLGRLDPTALLTAAVNLQGSRALLSGGSGVTERDCSNWSRIHTLGRGAGPFVGYAAGGKFAFFSDATRVLQVWDTTRACVVGRFPSGDCTAVVQTSSGCLLMGSRDGDIRMVCPGEERPVKILRGHSASVRGIALLGDERFAASIADDGSLRLWDLASGLELYPLVEGTQGLRTLTANGMILVAGRDDGTALLWDLSRPHRSLLLEDGARAAEEVAIGTGQRAQRGAATPIVARWFEDRGDWRGAAALFDACGALAAPADRLSKARVSLRLERWDGAAKDFAALRDEAPDPGHKLYFELLRCFAAARGNQVR